MYELFVSTIVLVVTELESSGGTTTTEPGHATDLLALENQVCFALAVASRRVIGLYRPLLEPMGLTHPQYLVMLALWRREPLTVKELADTLSLESATLSPLLKRLEATGYLTRTRNPLDERTLRLHLTSEGRALREQATGIPVAMMERLGMTVTELQDFHARLTEVIERTAEPTTD